MKIHFCCLIAKNFKTKKKTYEKRHTKIDFTSTKVEQTFFKWLKEQESYKMKQQQQQFVLTDIKIRQQTQGRQKHDSVHEVFC